MNFCAVQSDTDRHYSDIDRAESRDAQLRREYPLSDFEGDAVAELLAEGFNTLSQEAFEAAMRITLHHCCPDLMPRKYATDGLVRDELLVKGEIRDTVKESCERFQDEKINDPYIWNGIGE